MSRSAPTTSDLRLGSLQVSLVQQLIIIIMVMMIKVIMVARGHDDLDKDEYHGAHL